MLLSVIVCTYKRPDLIPGILECMISASKNAPENWELIFVDNAGDSEVEVICSSADLSAIELKYFHEATPGVSAARNRAVAESSGQWLLFLDDDVSFDENFISNMISAITDEEVDIICPRMITPAEPDWPDWLQVRLSSGVGQFELGDTRMLLNDKTKTPVGACVCIKRKIFDQFGPFQENLDRVGKKTFGGGETLVLWLAFQSGAKGVYLPHFTINHEFISGKNTKQYWRRQGFYGGRSSIRMNEYRSPVLPSNFKLAGLAGTSIAKSVIRFAVMVLKPKESFENQYRAIAHIGIAYEAIATIFSSRKPGVSN